MPKVTFGGFGATTSQVQSGPVVPAADSANNIGSRDVVGNKSDAAVTLVGIVASIMAYIKGILNNIAIPGQNSPVNTTIGQVVGDKTDTSQFVLDNSASLMRYMKGVVTTLIVQAADSILNVSIGDVIGNKSDAAQTTIGATRSLVAYVKGVLNSVRPANSTTVTATTLTSAAGIGVLGAWVQLIAALGSEAQEFNIIVKSPAGQATGLTSYTIALATGAVAAEVEVTRTPDFNISSSAVPYWSVVFHIRLVVASGTRISAAVANLTDANARTVDVSLQVSRL